MNIEEILNWRYSTKAFDPDKKITEEDFEKVKALLQMSPSSTNLQPWHFIIAHNKEGKERIAKGTRENFDFNTSKVINASHVIVYCTRVNADDQYMKHLLEQEDKDGRYKDEEAKQRTYNGRNLFANIHKYDAKDLQHWMEKQVYLNMGNLLLGVAAMGIDAVPMEGVDAKALDNEFGLREKGFTTLALVSLGYRKEDDFNAKLPKSRLPKDEIITVL